MVGQKYYAYYKILLFYSIALEASAIINVIRIVIATLKTIIETAKVYGFYFDLSTRSDDEFTKNIVFVLYVG